MKKEKFISKISIPINNFQEHNGHANVFSEQIETDGTAKLISYGVDVDEKSKEKPFTIRQMMEVTDATWVIKTVWKLGEIKHRILYTLENPQEIVGLPKLD